MGKKYKLMNRVFDWLLVAAIVISGGGYEGIKKSKAAGTYKISISQQLDNGDGKVRQDAVSGSFKIDGINWSGGEWISWGGVSEGWKEGDEITVRAKANSGFEFVKWHDHYNNKVVSTNSVYTMTFPNGNVYLCPFFRGVNHTLTFNYNGSGQADTSKTVRNTAEYGTLPTPTWTGHTFAGWFTAATGGTQVSASTVMPDSNQTVYAHWTVNKYTLTYNANGGSCNTASSTLSYGDKYGTLPGASLTGNTLLGWTKTKNGTDYVNANTTIGAANITIYAKWQKNKYTLTFDPNGGTCSEAGRQVEYQAKYGTLPTPVRAGYTFKGWSTIKNGTSYVNSGTVMGAGNTTVFATWEENGYTDTITEWDVLGDKNGIKLNNSARTWTKARKATAGASYTTMTKPVYTGFTFLSSTTETIASNTYSNQNKTVYNIYTRNNYKLTFHANGGICDVDSRMVGYNLAYGTLPDATKFGSRFLGWGRTKNSTSFVDEKTKMEAEDTNLYAIWEDYFDYDSVNRQLTIYRHDYRQQNDWSAQEDSLLLAETIILGKDITELDDLDISRFTMASVIKADSLNKTYKDVAGILYTKDGASLVYVPASFEGTLKVPAGIEKIEDKAFSDTRFVTDVILPYSVKEVGKNAFSSAVKTVTIQNEKTKIADGSIGKTTMIIGFLGSTAQEYAANQGSSFTMLTEIPTGFFEGGQFMEKFTVPDNIISIGKDAFWMCSNLETVTIGTMDMSISEDENTIPNHIAIECYYGSTAYEYALKYGNPIILKVGYEGYDETKEYLKDGANIKEVSFGPTIKKIGESAFEGTSLTKVQIPENVKELGKSAFKDCKGLKEITLQGVPVLPEEVLQGCEALTGIYMNGVLEIKDGALKETGLTGTLTLPDSVEFFGNDVITDTGITELRIENPNCIIADDVKDGENVALTIPDGVQIAGYENSTADIYAEKHEVIFVKTGTSYILILNPDGGKNGTALVYAANGKMLPDITVPEKDEYSFSGYYLYPNGIGEKFYDENGKGMKNWEIKSNVTLYADYVRSSYQVQYAANGGSGNMENSKLRLEEEYIIPNTSYEKEGYTFLGWSTNPKDTIPEYVTGEKVKGLFEKYGENPLLYAIWEEKKDLTDSEISPSPAAVKEKYEEEKSDIAAKEEREVKEGKIIEPDSTEPSTSPKDDALSSDYLYQDLYQNIDETDGNIKMVESGDSSVAYMNKEGELYLTGKAGESIITEVVEKEGKEYIYTYYVVVGEDGDVSVGRSETEVEEKETEKNNPVESPVMTVSEPAGEEKETIIEYAEETPGISDVSKVFSTESPFLPKTSAEPFAELSVEPSVAPAATASIDLTLPDPVTVSEEIISRTDLEKQGEDIHIAEVQLTEEITKDSGSTAKNKGSLAENSENIYKADGIVYQRKKNEAIVIKAADRAIKKAVIKAKVKIKGRIYPVTKVKRKAFQKCTRLKSITLPNTITAIGNAAFKNDKMLTKITIKSGHIQRIGRNGFKGIGKKAVFKIPKGKKKKYMRFLTQKAGITKYMTIKQAV